MIMVPPCTPQCLTLSSPPHDKGLSGSPCTPHCLSLTYTDTSSSSGSPCTPHCLTLTPPPHDKGLSGSPCIPHCLSLTYTDTSSSSGSPCTPHCPLIKGCMVPPVHHNVSPSPAPPRDRGPRLVKMSDKVRLPTIPTGCAIYTTLTVGFTTLPQYFLTKMTTTTDRGFTREAIDSDHYRHQHTHRAGNHNPSMHVTQLL